jgi:AbiU2
MKARFTKDDIGVSMTAHSAQVTEEFCKLCDWAYQVWLNHREMFDDNPRAEELQRSMGADALARLRTISHEYTLLQIAKLHDRVVVAGQVTLGIEYMVKYGAWGPVTAAKLGQLADELNGFAKGLLTVRNKALSHNDLAAVLSGATLGEFERDQDIQYFATLQQFADVVHGEVIGGPCPFDDLVKNDVVALMAMVKT